MFSTNTVEGILQQMSRWQNNPIYFSIVSLRSCKSPHLNLRAVRKRSLFHRCLNNRSITITQICLIYFHRQFRRSHVLIDLSQLNLATALYLTGKTDFIQNKNITFHFHPPEWQIKNKGCVVVVWSYNNCGDPHVCDMSNSMTGRLSLGKEKSVCSALSKCLHRLKCDVCGFCWGLTKELCKEFDILAFAKLKVLRSACDKLV